jgi:transposase
MARRKRFTPEFKREAVRMLQSSDKAPADIARDLGIHRNQLYKWKEQFGHGGSRPTAGRQLRSDDSGDELTRLKRELERVKEERDVMRKAAAYFAKELG